MYITFLPEFVSLFLVFFLHSILLVCFSWIFEIHCSYHFGCFHASLELQTFIYYSLVYQDLFQTLHESIQAYSLMLRSDNLSISQHLRLNYQIMNDYSYLEYSDYFFVVWMMVYFTFSIHVQKA
jgi:hypothetical protein